MTTAVSYHKQIIDIAVGMVQGLGLTLADGTTPLPTAQIYSQDLPWVAPPAVAGGTTAQPLPCIQVTLAAAAENFEGDEANTDNIGYPFAVTLIAAKNRALAIDDWFLTWRQQIQSLFHLRRPPTTPALVPISGGGATLNMFRWEPGVIIDLSLFQSAGLWVSGSVFRGIVRKTRP